MENEKVSKETTDNKPLSPESMDMNEGETSNGTIGGTGSDLDALEKSEEENKSKDGLKKEDKS